MDTDETKLIKSVEESIAGFASAGARLVVEASWIDNDDNTVDIAVVDSLIEIMMEKLKSTLNLYGGFPFDYSFKTIDCGYKIMGKIVIDMHSAWGVLLADRIIFKLLKAGCVSLRQSNDSGIQYTERFSTEKLRELNITVNEILYHPLFEMFYTAKGKKATVSYTRVLLSRNSSKTDYN